MLLREPQPRVLEAAERVLQVPVVGRVARGELLGVRRLELGLELREAPRVGRGALIERLLAEAPVPPRPRAGHLRLAAVALQRAADDGRGRLLGHDPMRVVDGLAERLDVVRVAPRGGRRHLRARAPAAEEALDDLEGPAVDDAREALHGRRAPLLPVRRRVELGQVRVRRRHGHARGERPAEQRAAVAVAVVARRAGDEDVAHPRDPRLVARARRRLERVVLGLLDGPLDVLERDGVLRADRVDAHGVEPREDAERRVAVARAHDRRLVAGPHDEGRARAVARARVDDLARPVVAERDADLAALRAQVHADAVRARVDDQHRGPPDAVLVRVVLHVDAVVAVLRPLGRVVVVDLVGPSRMCVRASTRKKRARRSTLRRTRAHPPRLRRRRPRGRAAPPPRSSTSWRGSGSGNCGTWPAPRARHRRRRTTGGGGRGRAGAGRSAGGGDLAAALFQLAEPSSPPSERGATKGRAKGCCKPISP